MMAAWHFLVQHVEAAEHSRGQALHSISWILLGHLPLMRKRGHFVIYGSPRVLVNACCHAAEAPRLTPLNGLQGSVEERIMEVVGEHKAGQDAAEKANSVAGSLSVDRQDLRASELTRLFTVGPALLSVSF